MEQQELQAFIDRQSYLEANDVRGHLLPIRSVGVGGDERSHLQVAAIEGSHLGAKELQKLAEDLPAHFRGSVNRVIFSLGMSDLGKHSVTKTLLTDDVRQQLRQADRIVFEEMRRYDLLGKIKQFPVVLLPVSFGEPGERSIVLRPVITSTFMTVQAMLPGRDLPSDFLENISGRIKTSVAGISEVFLEITNKPPATTEWE
jgi:GMP synthase (glutamine-hydrolysing)